MKSAISLGILVLALGAHYSGIDCEPGPSSERVLTDTYAYKISMAMDYTNTTDLPVSLKLRLPIIASRGYESGAAGPLSLRNCYQLVSELKLSPQPTSIGTDGYGNPYASFVFPEVQPGEAISVKQQATVEKQGVFYNMDARLCAAKPELSADLLPDWVREKASSSGSVELLPVSPLVRGLARAVTEREDNPYYAAVRLYDFVRCFNYQLHDKPKSTEQALMSRTVQCEDAARCLQALLAARRIPSRTVTGIVVQNDKPDNINTHCWLEADIGPYRRVPLDPTMGRFAESRASRLGQLEPQYIVFTQGATHDGLLVQGVPLKAVRKSIHTKQLWVRYSTSSVLHSPLQAGIYCRPYRSIDSLSQLLPSKLQARLQSLEQCPGSAQALSGLWQLCRQCPEAEAPEALNVALVQLAARSNQLLQLDRALKAARVTPQTLHARALTAIHLQNWSQAQALLDQAGSTVGSTVGSTAGSSSLSANVLEQTKALLYYRTKQSRRAADCLNRSAQQVLTAPALEMLMQLAMDSGSWSTQKQLSLLGCQIWPDDINYATALGRALFYGQDYSRALTVLFKLAQENPRDGYPYTILASLYAEQGDYVQALKYLKQSLSLELPSEERIINEQLLHDWQSSYAGQ